MQTRYCIVFIAQFAIRAASRRYLTETEIRNMVLKSCAVTRRWLRYKTLWF